MIYPNNLETKIGFTEIRQMLKERCLCALGEEQVDKMAFSPLHEEVTERLARVGEFRRMANTEKEMPMEYFLDPREAIRRTRVENTHMEEDELFDLRRSLGTIQGLADLSRKDDGDGHFLYPALARMADGVSTFPDIIRQIDRILNKWGKVSDNASPELARVRGELARSEGNISRALNSILRQAQGQGLVDKDATPTMRDGRLVIPVAPAMKRKVAGIVHDESATGRTVYIEPAKVVEANNRVRELRREERQEVIRILKEVTKQIRPYADELLESYRFLAEVDFVQAKVSLAERLGAIEPPVGEEPLIDWRHAIHPLLSLKLGDGVVPLDITLTPRQRLLIISGPNAGGKSVCLKTVGLLQYMLQCGLSVPMDERSQTGVFRDIMIDIGDEQSLENDLSTYSSHLLNMKVMMKACGGQSLILIDEMGSGTEPTIGAAIAEAVTDTFRQRQAFGVITTHYQNLKHYADGHEGVVNGAMLYDRHQMRPLFQLAIGRPGSSFAIEIARKIGLPEEVISEASRIVGSEYIQSDKYLQDIVRDKRYWEAKRQAIHQREKELAAAMARYEKEAGALREERREILDKAKAQAQEMLKESNRRIENTIREIKEAQAEKEETKRLRQELADFRAGLEEDTPPEAPAKGGKKAPDPEALEREMERIRQRKQRHQRRVAEKAQGEARAAKALREAAARPTAEEGPLEVGDTVRVKGLSSVGRIESLDGKTATVIFGDMRTKTRLDRLERAKEPEPDKNERRQASLQAYSVSDETRKTIDEHRRGFHQDLDVRGMRGDEALQAVQHFIDDAILVGMPRVRVLHGKGNGILRQLIRQYLASVPNVTHFADEHVQFGGAGITVVDL